MRHCGMFLILLLFAVTYSASDTAKTGTGNLDAHDKDNNIHAQAHMEFTHEDTHQDTPKDSNTAAGGKLRRLVEKVDELEAQVRAVKEKHDPVDTKPWKEKDKSFSPKPVSRKVDAVGSDGEKLQEEIDTLEQEVNAIGARITNLKRYTADMVRMIYSETNKTAKTQEAKPADIGESVPMDLEDALERMCPSEERRAKLSTECATHDSAISERVYDAESWSHIDDEHICFTSDNHNRFWDCVCSKCPIPFRLSPDHYDSWKAEYERRECHKLNAGKQFPRIGDNACDFVGKKWPKVKPDPVKPKAPKDASPKSAAPDGLATKMPVVIAGMTMAAALVGGLFIVMK